MVPTDGKFSNYTKVGNCSCAYCDSNCPAPPVNANIGFFDGFDLVLVAIVYAGLIVFSGAFFFIRRRFIDKDAGSEGNDKSDDDNNYLPGPKRVDTHGTAARQRKNINDSQVSSNMSVTQREVITPNRMSEKDD